MTRPPLLGPSLAAWCIGSGILLAVLHDNVRSYPWTPFDRWAVPTLMLAALSAAFVTWWMMRTAPLPPIRRATLNEMLAEDDPCGHIHALAEFMARRPVIIHLSEHDDEEPAIECQMCESVISFGYFGRLIVVATQGRN